MKHHNFFMCLIISVLLITGFHLLVPGFFHGLCWGRNLVPDEIKLSNGIRCLVYEDHSAPVFTLITWIKTGSKNDPPGKSGTAHFLEHYLYQGSKNNDRFDYQLAIYESAGYANAGTSYDFTSYTCTMPVSCLRDTIAREAARVFEPSFDPSLLEKEKYVVNDERRMRTDSSHQVRLFQELMKLALPGSAYAVSVSGEPDEFSSITVDDLKAFHHSWYTPSNIVVTIAGDVDKQSVEQVLESCFGKYTGEKTALKQEDLTMGVSRSETVAYKSRFTRFAIAYPVVGTHHDDYYKLLLMTEFLRYRLGLKLVGWNFYCSGINCGVTDSFDPPFLVINGTSRYMKEYNEIIKMVDQTIDDINKPIKIDLNPGWNVPEKYEKKVKKYLKRFEKKLAKLEFKAVKENLIASYTKFNIDSRSIAWDLGYYYLFGDEEHQFLERFAKRIDSVSRDDVSRMANKYLLKEKRYEIIFQPE